MGELTKEFVLDLTGEFTWMWGKEFFIETKEGNFVWKDPDYEGDNTLTKYNGSFADFCEECNAGFGRDKGMHQIRDYCGNDIIFRNLAFEVDFEENNIYYRVLKIVDTGMFQIDVREKGKWRYDIHGPMNSDDYINWMQNALYNAAHRLNEIHKKK